MPITTSTILNSAKALLSAIARPLIRLAQRVFAQRRAASGEAPPKVDPIATALEQTIGGLTGRATTSSWWQNAIAKAQQAGIDPDPIFRGESLWQWLDDAGVRQALRSLAVRRLSGPPDSQADSTDTVILKSKYEEHVGDIGAAAQGRIAVILDVLVAGFQADLATDRSARALGLQIRAGNETLVAKLDALKTELDEENPKTWNMLVDARVKERELADKLDFTQATIGNMLRIVGEDNVPSEQIPAKLIQLADRYVSLTQQVQQSLDTGPTDAALRQRANTYIESGEYHRAEMLLTAAKNQTRAVALLNAGHTDQALEALNEAERDLGDPSIQNTVGGRLQQGFNYKTQAQILSMTGDKAQAEKFVALAIELFERVRGGNPADTTVAEFAGATNGIGNIHHQRGEYRKAIAEYQSAISFLPTYAYAWHDMFAAYAALADLGDVDLRGMRRALDKLKQTGQGLPGLDASYIGSLDEILARHEP